MLLPWKLQAIEFMFKVLVKEGFMYLLENFIGEERIMLNSNFAKEIVKEVLDTSFVSQASFHMAISNTFAINLAENLD